MGFSVKKPAIAGLYVITTPPQSGQALSAWLDHCEAAILGGTRLMQYRDKTATETQRQQRASALLEVCRAHKVPLIVNDEVKLAKVIGADGVHLGRNDDSIQQARRQLGPSAIIGRSCYNDLALALTAQTNGADYVAFGAAFASPTKPEAVSAPLSLYAEATKKLTIPVVAIGGISPANAGQLAAVGVDAVAVISAVMAQTDPCQAAAAMCTAFATGQT